MTQFRKRVPHVRGQSIKPSHDLIRMDETEAHYDFGQPIGNLFKAAVYSVLRGPFEDAESDCSTRGIPNMNLTVAPTLKHANAHNTAIETCAGAMSQSSRKPKMIADEAAIAMICASLNAAARRRDRDGFASTGRSVASVIVGTVAVKSCRLRHDSDLMTLKTRDRLSSVDAYLRRARVAGHFVIEDDRADHFLPVIAHLEGADRECQR